MIIQLEITGGFTGPVGKQVISLDLAKLPGPEVERIRQDLNAIPANAWGQSFLSAHPKPWDFTHRLVLENTGIQKSIVFHLNEGPSALTTLAAKIVSLEH